MMKYSTRTTAALALFATVTTSLPATALPATTAFGLAPASAPSTPETARTASDNGVVGTITDVTPDAPTAPLTAYAQAPTLKVKLTLPAGQTLSKVTFNGDENPLPVDGDTVTVNLADAPTQNFDEAAIAVHTTTTAGGLPKRANLKWTLSTAIGHMYDTIAPTISSVSASGCGASNSDDCELSTSAVTWTVRVNDAATPGSSGLARAELLKDGNVVQTVDLSGNTDKVTSLSITAPGSYKVRAFDNAGKESTIDFPQGQVIPPDAVNPVLDLPAQVAGAREIDGVKYITDQLTGDLEFKFHDDGALKPAYMTFTLDGVALTPERASATEYKFKVPQSMMEDKHAHVLSFSGHDRAGNTVSWSANLAYSPAQSDYKLTTSSSDVFTPTPWGVYTNKHGISVTFTPTDGSPMPYTLKDASGVNNQGADLTISGNTLTIRNGDVDNVEVTVRDAVGREKRLNVGDILGWPHKHIYSSNAPTFSLDSDSYLPYAKSLTDFAPKTATMRDAKGIKKFKVSVNGITLAEGNPSAEENKPVPVKQVTLDYARAAGLPDGTYQITFDVTNLAGATSTSTATVTIDSTAPVISGFTITDPTYAPGKTIGGSDSRYGFFVTGKMKVAAHVTETGSGVDKITYTLRSSDGTTHTVEAPEGATIDIPDGFKGFVSAVASDKARNLSLVAQPDGLVSENGNTTITANDVNIALPEPVTHTRGGLGLYRDSVKANLEASAGHSGLRHIAWGIGADTLGDATVDIDGHVSNPQVHVTRTDKNLVTGITIPLEVNGDHENTEAWVRVEDNAGGSAEKRVQFSIDATAPEMSVTFDVNNANNMYNTDRHATIKVLDANFSPDLFKISGQAGELGAWTQTGDMWTNTMTFADNRDYEFSLDASDTVGHAAQGFHSEQFTVDKVPPVIAVSWNTYDARSGRYYNQPRSATVTITEDHFDPALVRFTGTGLVSGWSHAGNIHTATVSFPEGVNTFGVTSSDQAGNESNAVNEPEFVVDTTKPELAIEGVTQGTAYYQTPEIRLSYSDTNLDLGSLSVTLTGRKGTTFKVPVVNGHLDLSAIPNEAKSDDLYTMDAAVSDLAGNSNTAKVQFILNRFGSSVDVEGTSYQGKYVKAPIDVDLSEITVEKLRDDKLEIRVTLNGKTIEVPKNAVTVTVTGGENGDYVYHYHVDKSVFKEDGAYTVQVFSQTEGGKDQLSRLSYSFVVDSVKPEIQVSGITDGGSYRKTQVTATVTLRDMTATELIATLDGKDVKATKNGDDTYTLIIPQAASAHNVHFKATDQAGNVSEVTVKDVYVNASWFRQVLNWTGRHIGIVAGGLFGVMALVAGWILFAARKKRGDDEEQA